MTRSASSSQPKRSPTASVRLALVLMLIFHERLVASWRGWWLVTDLIALGLGLFGLYYCLRRRSRLRRGLSADPSEGRFVRRK